MSAISWCSSRYMRLKRLQPACNRPTSILTARWIVCASTNAESMPLVRRAFMWATCLHGSWTTGTAWDGMRHSILGKYFLLNEKKPNRISKTSSRWHGDPNVRRPPARSRPMGPPTLPIQHAQANEPPQEPTLRTEDSPVIDRTTADPPPVPHFERTYDISYPSAPDPGEAIPSPPQTPSTAPVGQHHLASYATPPTPVTSTTDQLPPNSGAMAQTLVSACMRLLQAQADDSKMRLEYLRRREDREEADSRLRMEMEKKRQEREAVDSERLQQNAKMKQKSELATELLSNPNVDPSVKAAAGDYLKKLFAND